MWPWYISHDIQLFNDMYSLTTTGIPTALSCLVAKKCPTRQKMQIYFYIYFICSIFISLLISLIVSFNSTYLSFRLLQRNLNLFVLSICPAIVIISISNVLRGYFYGIKSYGSCYRSSN